MTFGHQPLCGSILACLLACPFCGGCPRTAAGQGFGGDKKQIPEFRLKDTAGRDVALSDFADKKAVVVVFIGTECPLVNLYVPRLVDLHRDLASRGVQFIAINSNNQDSAEAIAKHAKDRKIPFPVLKDDDQKVANLFAAERIPEAFLLDGTGAVRYRGRIDDQFAVGGAARPQPTRHDLAEAIKEVLANRPVSVPRTQAAGCLFTPVKPPAVSEPDAPARALARAAGSEKVEEGRTEITYAKHVAPLLQKHCQECHCPGQVAPFSLLTYKQARNWSAMIGEVIREGRMPPWGADPRYGEFANDRRLPETDRKILLAWIDQGCPKGDDKDLPPPRPIPQDWAIANPDLVLSMQKAHRIPALPPKGGIPYQYFVLPTNFKNDVWVQAVEARPGNRAVVHHMVLYIGDPPGRQVQTGDRDILVGFVPGSKPAIYPAGLGKRIPKGAKLVLEMHYTANGTEQTDLSSIALVFAKELPKHEVRVRFVENRRFVIPPRAANHKVTAATTFEKDAVVLSLTPHMHLRGKSFLFRAVYPDRGTEILLSVPRYDFNWQHTYILKKPLRVPAGTKIECVGRFDNSPANPNNPDPDQAVRWGDQTWEEMMLGVVGYYFPADPATPSGPFATKSCRQGKKLTWKIAHGKSPIGEEASNPSGV